MPGARLESFRRGDRTELLVEYWLSALAFTTRVPRQEDVGHDFVCALAEPRDGMIWAGPSFTVQAKSNASPLVFATEYGRLWIREQDNPLFLAIGHRDECRVDLYSTWQRVNAAMDGAGEVVSMFLGPPPDPGSDVELSADSRTQSIYVGKPIASATLDELAHPERLAKTRAVVRRWVEIDRENIVCTRAGMHWVVGPSEYDTNQEPSPDRMQLSLYFNHANLRTCARNFGRAAAALRVTLQNHPALEGARSQVDVLDRALIAWEAALDQGAKAALTTLAKLDLSEKFELFPDG